MLEVARGHRLSPEEEEQEAALLLKGLPPWHQQITVGGGGVAARCIRTAYCTCAAIVADRG